MAGAVRQFGLDQFVEVARKAVVGGADGDQAGLPAQHIEIQPGVLTANAAPPTPTNSARRSQPATGRSRTHSSVSNSPSPQPVECSKPTVSNAVIGLAPLRPA